MGFRLRIFAALLFICTITTIIYTTTPVFAAVELNSFVVTETSDGKVELRWVTSTEQDVSRFLIRRVADDASNFTPVAWYYDAETDPQLIQVRYEGNLVTVVPAEGNPAVGYTYVAIDENVEDGNDYVYMIVQMEWSGLYEPADDHDEHIKRLSVGKNPDTSSHIYLPVVSHR